MSRNTLHESRQIQIAEHLLVGAEHAKKLRDVKLLEHLSAIAWAIEIDTSNNHVSFFDLRDYIDDVRYAIENNSSLSDAGLVEEYEALRQAIKDGKQHYFS